MSPQTFISPRQLRRVLAILALTLTPASVTSYQTVLVPYQRGASIAVLCEIE